jgi:hypothetical protein
MKTALVVAAAAIVAPFSVLSSPAAQADIPDCHQFVDNLLAYTYCLAYGPSNTPPNNTNGLLSSPAPVPAPAGS